MADKRMIARVVSQSRKVNSLSLRAALLWTWAIPWFDGYGFIEAEPDFLKLNVVPRRTDISEKDLVDILKELSTGGLWKIYKDNATGKLIAYDPKFSEFQNLRMDREGKQRFTPGELLDYSGTTPAEDKIREVKIREDRKESNYPPLPPKESAKIEPPTDTKHLWRTCSQCHKETPKTEMEDGRCFACIHKDKDIEVARGHIANILKEI